MRPSDSPITGTSSGIKWTSTRESLNHIISVIYWLDNAPPTCAAKGADPQRGYTRPGTGSLPDCDFGCPFPHKLLRFVGDGFRDAICGCLIATGTRGPCVTRE
jgi:hypothetical protein